MPLVFLPHRHFSLFFRIILLFFIFSFQAALCCIRILRHLPEHVEDFMERIMNVLKDRHHGVLVAGVQLITSIVESNCKVNGLSLFPTAAVAVVLDSRISPSP